jgi:phosphatidylglycerophosphate synthase
MTLHKGRFWLVQSISLFRLFAALLFVSLAFKGVPHTLLLCLYAFAIVSDLLDGYLSRKLKSETYFGEVVDLVADKSLTIVSLLYAAARGIDILPLALIATRDVIMIGMRLIIIERTQLLPTNRILGGIMALLLWGNTWVLVYAQTDAELIRATNVIYWICAIIFVVNLLIRIYVSAQRIKVASIDSPE